MGCDPVDDQVILDLASLKNGITRQLLYDQMKIKHDRRSKYKLILNNYILTNQDMDEFVRILGIWAQMSTDMARLSRGFVDVEIPSSTAIDQESDRSGVDPRIQV